MSLLLKFDEADNPMYLKKVGNWIITFLNTTESSQHSPIRLAICSVLPVQRSEHIQPRYIHLCQTTDNTIWQIETAEYFSSEQNQYYSGYFEHNLMYEMVEKIVCEFKRYDVEIEIISPEKS